MSWKHGGGGRRGYHHGNLRQALIDSALELIAEKGPAGFTIAEAARAAGVSPGAPYRHFRDREDLLADVARMGFERFADALEAAWAEGTPTPLAALQRMGRSYLMFARLEPAYYSAMFDTRLHGGGPELLAASGRAFDILHLGVKTLCEKLPDTLRPPSLMVAVHIWATSHGIASLFATQEALKLPTPPEELLEAAILIYLRGLGIAGGNAPTQDAGA